jgi:hypothetical protein
MAGYLGNNAWNNVYLGSNTATGVYFGSNKVWPITTGSVIPSFGIGFNLQTRDAIISSDGGMLMIGSFTTYNGVSQSRITKLFANGDIDTSFNIGSGFGVTGFINQAESIIELSDGTFVVGSNSTSYSGSVVPRVLKLNPNGTRNTTFAPNIAPDNNVAEVKEIGNNIWVGGMFTNASRNYLIIMDKTTGASQTRTYNPPNWVYSIVPDISESKVLVTGVGFVTRVSNTTAVVDTSFTSSWNGGGNITAIAVQQPDSKYILGGALGISRFNNSGSFDPTFNTGSGFSVL